MKKRIILWIALTMLLSLGAILSVSAAEASDTIHVVINGNEVAFPANLGKPYVDENWRTQVPVRGAMEAYGAYVDWDADAHTAIVQYRSVGVRLPIGQNYLISNGQIRSMDTKALIRNDRTYLPIRYVVEALGGSVTWDQSTLTVNINNPSYPYAQKTAGSQKAPGAYDAYQNALLIGDSLTTGIRSAAGITGADFFCENGLALRKVISGGGVADGTYTITYEPDPENPEGEPVEKKIPNTITLKEQLQKKQYSRIFIILGINDVGYQSPKTFSQNYQTLLDQIRAAQPNAMIIAEEILPVTAARSSTDRYFNNPSVDQHNAVIEEVARNNSILCVDGSWAVEDPATGALAAANSFDGLHMYGTVYKKWAQYVGRIVP